MRVQHRRRSPSSGVAPLARTKRVIVMKARRICDFMFVEVVFPCPERRVDHSSLSLTYIIAICTRVWSVPSCCCIVPRNQ